VHKLLLFLTILVSLPAQAQLYVLGQGGYFVLNQEATDANNVTPAGYSYGGGIGMRKNYFEFEVSLLKASGTADLAHDGVDNSLNHEQTTLSFSLNFYLSKAFYARMGYSTHKIDQSFGEEFSPVSQAGAEDEYDLKEGSTSEGFNLGAGYVIFDGSNTSLFVQIERFNYATFNGGAWNTSLGFRIYTN
jgi:hypothetical protein